MGYGLVPSFSTTPTRSNAMDDQEEEEAISLVVIHAHEHSRPSEGDLYGMGPKT